MNTLSLILLFLVFSSYAEEYTGPKTPGVEKYSCGEYEVKGKLKRIENKDKSISLNFLIPYAETTRAYKIKLNGDLRQIKDGTYIQITGKSFRDWGNDRPELYISKRPKIISEMNSLKNTVQLIKSMPCK